MAPGGLPGLAACDVDFIHCVCKKCATHLLLNKGFLKIEREKTRPINPQLFDGLTATSLREIAHCSLKLTKQWASIS